LRLGGTNLNGFVLADCVLPRLDAATETELATIALRLCAVLPWHGMLWQQACDEGWLAAAEPVVEPHQRRALATRIDLLTGRAFGLAVDDVAWIVRGCGLPSSAQRNTAAVHGKGFWRIERELPREQRRPIRWLAAASQAQSAY
jgi:hypothetical protein